MSTANSRPNPRRSSHNAQAGGGPVVARTASRLCRPTRFEGTQPSIGSFPLSAQSHPVFALSSDFVDEVAALAPTWATYAGVAGVDHRWPDLSPAGHAAVRILAQLRPVLGRDVRAGD